MLSEFIQRGFEPVRLVGMATRYPALLFVTGVCACGPAIDEPSELEPTPTSSSTSQNEPETSDSSTSSGGVAPVPQPTDLGSPPPPSCTIEGTEKPSAALIEDGTRIELQPSGVRFTVPTVVQESANSTFLLSEEELVVAENGAGEWTTEYTAVINALLPFDRCGAHFGDNSWPVSGSFFALWTRGYILEDSIAETEAFFIDNAAAVAEAAGGTEAQVSQKLGFAWRQTRVSFDLDYPDYPGAATVEMHLREYGGFTLGFVFMYPASVGGFPDPAEAVNELLYSVCVPAGGGGCCEG